MRVAAAPAFWTRHRNPYQALLYDALVARGVEVLEFEPRTAVGQRPDVVHLHWPEGALNKVSRAAAAYRSLELLLALVRLRRRRIPIVWTVHNLQSHARRYPRAERLFWRAFLPLVSGWISLSEGATKAACAEHPRLARLPHAVVPHGHYRQAYPDADRGDARRILGLLPHQRLVVFVGRVKPYKGVPELITAFQAMADPDARLLVAGRCDESELAAELRRQVVDARVTMRLEEVSDDEVPRLLRAADLVVLPFRAVLNSGSAVLALSFDVPVLCPRVGALGELADIAPGWVTTYDGPLDGAVLAAALDAGRRDGRPDLRALDWDVIAAETERFYASLLPAHALPR